MIEDYMGRIAHIVRSQSRNKSVDWLPSDEIDLLYQRLEVWTQRVRPRLGRSLKIGLRRLRTPDSSPVNRTIYSAEDLTISGNSRKKFSRVRIPGLTASRFSSSIKRAKSSVRSPFVIQPTNQP